MRVIVYQSLGGFPMVGVVRVSHSHVYCMDDDVGRLDEFLLSLG